MAYVHPDKPDIFISYAHVDDGPDPAFADRLGWVTTLVRCLEKRIAKKLGRVNSQGCTSRQGKRTTESNGIFLRSERAR